MGLEARMDLLAAFASAAHWHTVDLLYEPTLAVRVIDCPLCGHISTRDGYRLHESACQFGGGRLERYQCPDCDFVFGPLKMLDLSEHMLSADYRLLYETYREANSLEAEMRAFRTCKPAEGGLYLDWGCGAWSGTVDALRGEGYDVWGFEPSVPPESPFIAGSRDEISANFDGIFSNNVIEHLRDPIAEFLAMKERLKPGGVMVHATPCYDLLYEHTRFHCSFFLGRSVEVLAAKVGLDIVSQERDGEYMSRTFRKP